MHANEEGMRDVLDCGVLLAPGHESTMGAWIAGHQARLTRVRLHPVSLAPPALAEAPPDSRPAGVVATAL